MEIRLQIPVAQLCFVNHCPLSAVSIEFSFLLKIVLIQFFLFHWNHLCLYSIRLSFRRCVFSRFANSVLKSMVSVPRSAARASCSMPFFWSVDWDWVFSARSTLCFRSSDNPVSNRYGPFSIVPSIDLDFSSIKNDANNYPRRQEGKKIDGKILGRDHIRTIVLFGTCSV